MGQSISIRYVRTEDRSFWHSLDPHLAEAELERKVRDRQGYVLLADDRPAGILRYNLFWDQIPFCTLLILAEDRRGQGLGAALIRRWEADMKAQGHSLLLTSTQSDETAQHFYRKLGWQDAGALLMNSFPGHEQPAELFFGKPI